MLIAQKKRKENIAEYILYLYQVEDLIRAFQSDLDLINERLVTAYKANEKTSGEISDWYANLVIMMEKERITDKGHLQFLLNLIAEINQLHLKLLSSESEKAYNQSFNTISGILSELKQKNKTAENDIQVGLDAIYGYLLLKMKKAEISEETEQAIKLLSHWLGQLSGKFREFESGTLEI